MGYRLGLTKEENVSWACSCCPLLLCLDHCGQLPLTAAATLWVTAVSPELYAKQAASLSCFAEHSVVSMRWANKEQVLLKAMAEQSAECMIKNLKNGIEN